jgi:phage baseplate assembly protein W
MSFLHYLISKPIDSMKKKKIVNALAKTESRLTIKAISVSEGAKQGKEAT